jgi:predicted ATPase
MAINPNSDEAWLNNVNVETDVNKYPFFLTGVEIERFRQISGMVVKFEHPISVISGSNKSGKTSILSTIACSHFDFQMRNPGSGNLERITWSKMVKFTKYDLQAEDWVYHLSYRLGTHSQRKRGVRKASTKKWSGLGKKESQIKERQVVYIDVDRVAPARSYSQSLFYKTQSSTPTPVSATTLEYLSYILEETYSGSNALGSHQNKDSYSFNNTYSSFNCASGEDALMGILASIVNAETKSLILIDELELGLHPKIQRRLIDVIKFESRINKKQFIITTHSASVISSFEKPSRLFIERNPDGTSSSRAALSVNATLTKMDSSIYPAINIACEDLTSKKIISHCIQNRISAANRRLINMFEMGSANKTFRYYKLTQEANQYMKIKTPVCCILDGDMRNERDANGQLQFPPEPSLFFIHSNEAPEKMLLREYLAAHPNTSLSYHLGNSNAHILLSKCVEEGIGTNETEAALALIEYFATTTEGDQYMGALSTFINSQIDADI